MPILTYVWKKGKINIRADLYQRPVQSMEEKGMDKDKKAEQSDKVIQNESLRVQKAEWVKQQVDKQREMEDETRAVLLEEQRILDEMRRSIEEHMERTKEIRKYNADCQEQMKEQVYALNGLSEDKLQGMKEYKNAYYQGLALALFLLSIILTGICGYLHGFDSGITLFMLACSGIEGSLLSQESRRGRFLDTICRCLYPLVFLVMLAMFVCFELGSAEYKVLLPFFVMAGAVILVIGTGAYFVYNPYRREKKKIRYAKADLKEIEQEAEKAVKKNQKLRKKEEARLARMKKREELRLEKIQQKEAVKLNRLQQREEAKLLRLQKKEEARTVLLEKKEEFKLIRQQKKVKDEKTELILKDETVKNNEKLTDNGMDKETERRSRKLEILDAAEVTPVEQEKPAAKPETSMEQIEEDIFKYKNDEGETEKNNAEADEDTVPKLKVVEKVQ